MSNLDPYHLLVDPTRPAIERRLRRAAAVLILAAIALAIPLGCTTTVRPPTQLAEPTSVYIVDHGRTPSLVLPEGEGFTRWAYGDWRYYAQGRTNVFVGAAALLWPTQGGLGRMAHDAPAEPTAIRAALLVPVEAVHEVRVEREAVRQLRQRLERHHRAEAATELFNPAAELLFVEHPRRYTFFFYNSNHAVADWLRELECEVGFVAPISRWRVERP